MTFLVTEDFSYGVGFIIASTVINFEVEKKNFKPLDSSRVKNKYH